MHIKGVKYIEKKKIPRELGNNKSKQAILVLPSFLPILAKNRRNCHFYLTQL